MTDDTAAPADRAEPHRHGGDDAVRRRARPRARRAASPDEVVGQLAWRPDLCTTFGALHGGVLMAMADSIGAVCAFLNLPAGRDDVDDRVEDELLPRRARGHRALDDAPAARRAHDDRRADRRHRRPRQARRPGHPDPGRHRRRRLIVPRPDIGRPEPADSGPDERRRAMTMAPMPHRTTEELQAGLDGDRRLADRDRPARADRPPPGRRRARGARGRRARPRARVGR